MQNLINRLLNYLGFIMLELMILVQFCSIETLTSWGGKVIVFCGAALLTFCYEDFQNKLN